MSKKDQTLSLSFCKEKFVLGYLDDSYSLKGL